MQATRIGLCALLLAALSATWLSIEAKKPAFEDLASVEGRLDAAKRVKLKIDTSGIKKGKHAPVRIAIADFEVRFNHRIQPYRGMYAYDETEAREIEVEWNDPDYQQLTDRMYDVFVENLENEGFDIVPMEILISSEPYERLRTEATAKSRAGDLGFTPYGMKDAKLDGVVAFRKLLPWINRQLGTDAVVTVRLELSLCGLRKGLFNKKKVGHLCVGRVDTGFQREGKEAPFEMRFWGGYREQKMFPKGKLLLGPKWENGVVKEFEPAIYYDEDLAAAVRKGWLGLEADPDLQAYADGAVGLFDALVRIGLTGYKERLK